jgi:hypothetical protein
MLINGLVWIGGRESSNSLLFARSFLPSATALMARLRDL